MGPRADDRPDGREYLPRIAHPGPTALPPSAGRMGPIPHAIEGAVPLRLRRSPRRRRDGRARPQCGAGNPERLGPPAGVTLGRGVRRRDRGRRPQRPRRCDLPRALPIWKDVHKTQKGLASFSAKDAQTYPRFIEFLSQFAEALDPILTMTPPNLPSPSWGEGVSLFRRALRLRRLGKRAMQQMLRLPPMSIRDFLNEWFETELLKASFAVDGLIGTYEGPFSPGTAFGLVPRFRPDVHGTGSSLAGEGVPPHFRVCPSVEYIERAYDDAKYGKPSTAPFLDVTVPTVVDPDLAPPGKHVMSVLVQYAPYALRRGEWATEGKKLAERVTAILEDHMPGLERLILHRQILTPVDLEERFGLTEGHIYHGEMTLDQSLVLRPVPGWSRYRTPVEGLYLCGSGSHPGGGITGAPGYNAAREILKDWPRFSA